MRAVKKISTFAAALSLLAVIGCSATDDDVTLGEAIDDTVITARVKAALVDADDLAASEIQVETRDGVVQLSGFVDESGDIARATDVAEDVEGVRSVRNDIVLADR